MADACERHDGDPKRERNETRKDWRASMSVIHSNLSNGQLTGERFGDIERPRHLFPAHGTAAAEATSMVGRRT